MLTKLGSLIEKRPWFIVTIVILVTIGFGIFVPSLEFKTDFQEFTPDDKLVKANDRVLDNFGGNRQVMLLYMKKQRVESILSPLALNEQYYIQQQLKEIPAVSSVFGITTFLEHLCLLEYQEKLDHCTDEQLNTILEDLLTEQIPTEVKVLASDDPDEPFEYQRFPRLSKGKSIDSLDIKNCYLSLNNTSITFSFEVYDLSNLASDLKSPFPFSNTVEWYLDFENILIPADQLDIQYRIAAHIEPKHALWEIGKGFFHNLKSFFFHLKNRELLNTYQQNVYLWLKPPGESIRFPLPLKSARIVFEDNRDRINIHVPTEELASFGIAPQVNSIKIPAKLSNFKGGTRYYQTPILKLPWTRITANTTFLSERFQKILSHPYLKDIANRFLQKLANVSLDDYEQFFSTIDNHVPLPDRIALKDIESSWTPSDRAPDTGVSSSSLFMRPYLFEELKVDFLGFLSQDYERTGKPESSLIIVQLNITGGYEDIVKINQDILEQLEDIDNDRDYVSISATGQGVLSTQINEVTSEANRIIAPLIFIIIVIILFVNFRKPSYVFLPMLALVVSTIWLFGTMALLGIEFNVIAVALVPLVLGLGVDYSVHLFHNYRVELEKGLIPSDAIKRSVKTIGAAIFLAMITTVIAFLSFLTASVPPVREFGLLLALGVSYTFVTALTLLPALRYIIDQKKTMKPLRQLKFYSVRNIMGKTANTLLSHKKKIMVIMLFISIILISGAVRIKTGFDPDQFIPEDSPAVQLFDKIAREFPYSSQNQEYILIEGDVATVKALQGIAQTHRNLEDDSFVSRNIDESVKSRSIYTVIQQAINNNESLVSSYNIDPETGIPQSDRDVKALYDYLFFKKNGKIEETISGFFGLSQEDMELEIGDLGVDIRSVLHKTNSRYDATVIRVFTVQGLQSQNGIINEELETLKRELNNDIENYGDAIATATGQFIIQLTITNSLTESQSISTGISLILAAIVLILAYRNLLLGLIAMIPVSISLLWILGTMYYIGYTLNALTITVTSMTIGIGIDYAIHATERFRFIADKTGDITESVCEMVSHTGGALLIAALTTTLGFGVLVFAPIPPQQQFGIILAITILYSFLTSVLILPLVLARWAYWRKEKKGYIITPVGMTPNRGITSSSISESNDVSKKK